MDKIQLYLVVLVFITYNTGIWSGRKLERLDVATKKQSQPNSHKILNLIISFASLLAGAYTVVWLLK